MPSFENWADHRRMDVQPHRAASDRRDMPNQMCFQGVWYRRRSKTQTARWPPSLAPSPSGAILYQPLHGVEPSIFPLEIRLGLEVGLATPALTDASAKRRSRSARIASWSI